MRANGFDATAGTSLLPVCVFILLLCVASPNIPRHAPVRNARPRPLAAGGLASLEPRRRFRRHPPQRALPVAECGALYAAPVFGGGPGLPPSPS